MNSSGNRLICQFCNKYEHVVMECWHRFDEYFLPTSSKIHTQETAYGATDQSHSNQASQGANSTQATTMLAHNDMLQILQGLESQAWCA